MPTPKKKKPTRRKRQKDTYVEDFLTICDFVGKAKCGVFFYPDFLAGVAKEIKSGQQAEQS